jgi:hypothetical protein
LHHMCQTALKLELLMQLKMLFIKYAKKINELEYL